MNPVEIFKICKKCKLISDCLDLYYKDGCPALQALKALKEKENNE